MEKEINYLPKQDNSEGKVACSQCGKMVAKEKMEKASTGEQVCNNCRTLDIVGDLPMRKI